MINYVLITKPGIILGNLVTFAAGFLLASKGQFHPMLFAASLLGLGFIIASACVFNNTIDRAVDQKMERTKGRAVASGKVLPGQAIVFALLLAAIGNLTLATQTNLLAAAVANVGFFVYVLLYSFLKSKTAYSTLIGSISGAIPPVVGYCAVSGQLDMAAGILFLMMIFWQMPHFFAIALWHLEDYTKAGIPVLPVLEGVEKTKRRMMLYIIGLIPIVALFTFLGYTGYFFLMATLAIGSAWLVFCLKGFEAEGHKSWGKQMFRMSLVKINAICLLIPFDIV